MQPREPARSPRGPRSGSPPGATREAIAESARRQFAELGYGHATLRGIAEEAGVDQRLVTHYFGSKQALFVAVFQVPFDPAAAFGQLLAGDPAELGERVARFILGVLSAEAPRRTIAGTVRAAASEPEVAELLGRALHEQLIKPIARQLIADQPELRASLLAAQVVGLVLARHIVAVQPLASADHEQLIAALAPVAQHYLTGPLGPE